MYRIVPDCTRNRNRRAGQCGYGTTGERRRRGVQAGRWRTQPLWPPSRREGPGVPDQADPGEKWGSVDWKEVFLFRSAFGADPVIGQVLKSSAGLDAVFQVALGRIVDVAAGA